jgi:hypothetical protein
MGKHNSRQRFTQDELALILRMGATDDEIKTEIRSPRYWTYIVRHPRGFVTAWGKGRSRQACERNAVKSALRAVVEDLWELDACTLGHWRFVLWPPEGHGRQVATARSES